MWGSSFPPANQVRIVTLAGHDALLMPYVRQVTDEDLKKKDVVEAIKRARDEMMKSKLVHGDFRKRHIGLITPTNTTDPLKCIFFDLSEVYSIDDSEHMEEFQVKFSSLNFDQSINEFS